MQRNIVHCHERMLNLFCKFLKIFIEAFFFSQNQTKRNSKKLVIKIEYQIVIFSFSFFFRSNYSIYNMIRLPHDCVKPPLKVLNYKISCLLSSCSVNRSYCGQFFYFVFTLCRIWLLHFFLFLFFFSLLS